MTGHTVTCLHCGSEKTCKAGFTKNGKQRFYCRACRRFSRESPAVRGGTPSSAGKRRVGALPSAGHLILQLRAFEQRLDRTPTTADIQKLSRAGRSFPLGVYYQLFGSFSVAIKKAGLRPRYKQEFDKEKLLDEIRALRRKLKRALIARDVAAARKRGEVSSLYHFQRAFGSVPEAIKAADADRGRFAKSEIIKHLRSLHGELRRVPTGKDIAARFVPGVTPSLKEILSAFGSLRRARQAAGVRYGLGNGKDTVYWQKYTPEELLEQARRLSEEIGRSPTDRDLNRGSKDGKCASAETFRRSFGSLKEVLRRIDLRED